MTTFQFLLIHQFMAICVLAPLKFFWHLVKSKSHFLFNLYFIWHLDSLFTADNSLPSEQFFSRLNDSALFQMFLPSLWSFLTLLCASAFPSANPLKKLLLFKILSQAFFCSHSIYFY